MSHTATQYSTCVANFTQFHICVKFAQVSCPSSAAQLANILCCTRSDRAAATYIVTLLHHSSARRNLFIFKQLLDLFTLFPTLPINIHALLDVSVNYLYSVN